MLKDFISAKRGGICGVVAKRYINSQSQSQGRSHSQSQSQSHSQNQCQIQIQNQSQRSILHIDANYLYGYALMQQLPYKDFEYSNVTLDEVLNTPDDSDYGYWLFCDLDYTNECKDRTSNFQLPPYKREVENIELGY